MKKLFNPLAPKHKTSPEQARRESLRAQAIHDDASAPRLRENAQAARERRAAADPIAPPTPPPLEDSEPHRSHDAETIRQKELIDAAARGAAIAAGMSHEHRHRPRRHISLRLVIVLILLAALTAAILLIYPKVRDAAVLPAVNITVPESLEELLPDETMGYNHIDFSEAILGEARQRQELVVMEQDVEVPVQITQALGNIELFKKTRVIHSFGTGVYTVDLAALDANSISSDDAAQLVTILVPHAVLQYVNVDKDKTTLEDTKKAIFAIGEIKLTAEQQKILDQTVSDAMQKKLTDDAMFQKADEVALSKVRAIFQPLVTALADDYIVKIVME